MRVDSGRGLSMDIDSEDYEVSRSDPNLISMGRATSRTDHAPDNVPRPFSSTAVLQRGGFQMESHSNSTGQPQSSGLSVCVCVCVCIHVS